MSTAGLRNISCPTFDGHEYPRWKAMMKKRLMAMDRELWTITEIGLTDLCKMAEADDIRKYTLLNLTTKDVICSSLSRNQFRNVMHLNHAKLIWDRLSEVYEGHRTRHDPWFEDYKESLNAMTFEPESSSFASCLMAKYAKDDQPKAIEWVLDSGCTNHMTGDKNLLWMPHYLRRI